uniref:Uncharacterized protein n=1 Tax=Anabas testudineus TaxID=64144 RepID=A0A3Q1J5P2_ANATE
MTTTDGPDLTEGMEKVRTLKHFPPYGSINGNSTGDVCPTCRQEDQLVAVIPCNDVRLKPRRTKLYMCVSMAACLFLCCLILFFLFPRSVTLSPVSVQSVMVYFTTDTVEMDVTNLINITNENFVPVQIVEFHIQGLVDDMVVGKKKISNLTAIQSHSQKLVSFLKMVHIKIFYGAPINCSVSYSAYCKSTSISTHILFVQLMTMNISYLSHTEQVSLDTFEFIDCGTNSTIPHPVNR